MTKGLVWESTPPVYTHSGKLIDGYVSHEGETCKGEALAGVLVTSSSKGTIHATVFTDGVVLSVFGFNHMPRTAHFVGVRESDVLDVAREFVGDVEFYGTSPERPYHHH